MLSLTLSKSAKKDFAKLPNRDRVKVHKKIKILALNPLSGKRLTGDLKKYYSLRAWPYRLIYEFTRSERKIIVHKIQHRQGVYKK